MLRKGFCGLTRKETAMTAPATHPPFCTTSRGFEIVFGTWALLTHPKRQFRHTRVSFTVVARFHLREDCVRAAHKNA